MVVECLLVGLFWFVLYLVYLCCMLLVLLILRVVLLKLLWWYSLLIFLFLCGKRRCWCLILICRLMWFWFWWVRSVGSRLMSVGRCWCICFLICWMVFVILILSGLLCGGWVILILFCLRCLISCLKVFSMVGWMCCWVLFVWLMCKIVCRILLIGLIIVWVWWWWCRSILGCCLGVMIMCWLIVCLIWVLLCKMGWRLVIIIWFWLFLIVWVFMEFCRLWVKLMSCGVIVIWRFVVLVWLWLSFRVIFCSISRGLNIYLSICVWFLFILMRIFCWFWIWWCCRLMWVLK